VNGQDKSIVAPWTSAHAAIRQCGIARYVAQVIVHAVSRPLIFLDVDGVLIPFVARPGRRLRAADSPQQGNPLLERLDPDDGCRLSALPCDLIWATTWMAEANETIAPRLGLAALPIVEFPDTDDQPPPGLHWKTQFLTHWADGRPFIWLDDETTNADQRWIDTHHPGRALVHRVDSAIGLTAQDFALIRQWLTT
jgi:hypothetical protein